MTLKNTFFFTLILFGSSTPLLGMWWGYKALEYEEEYDREALKNDYYSGWAASFKMSDEQYKKYLDKIQQEEKERLEKKRQEEFNNRPHVFNQLLAARLKENSLYFSLLPTEIFKMAGEYYLEKK